MPVTVSTLRNACQGALETVREFSGRFPGTVTTQALCVGAALGVVSYLLLRKRHRLPPGPFPLPLIGNLLSTGFSKEPLYIMLARLTEIYGPVVTMYLGPLPCVFLNKADVVTEAMVKKADAFSGRPHLYSLEFFSNGFKNISLADDTPAWKTHRKLAVHALRRYMSGSHLEEVVHDVITKAMDKMLNEKGAFSPKNITMSTMFVIINKFCFGGSTGFEDPVVVEMQEIFQNFNTDAGNGFFEDIIPPLRYFPTPKFRRFVDRLKRFQGYLDEQIEEHRKTFSRDNIRDIADSILLAQMEAELEEGSEAMRFFTNDHIGQTMADVFGAGIDTSRVTLDWGLYFLACFPRVQRRMQEELDAVTGSELPGLKDRPRLPYCEATLYEIMRLGAVAPLGLPHKTTSDSTLCGYDIPENTTVFINIWALSRDPAYWDQPDEFRPERFLDEDGKLKTRFEGFIPFSIGRRSCMGEVVAKPELFLLFACIVKRLNISLAPGYVYDLKPAPSGLLAHEARPYMITVSKRSSE